MSQRESVKITLPVDLVALMDSSRRDLDLSRSEYIERLISESSGELSAQISRPRSEKRTEKHKKTTKRSEKNSKPQSTVPVESGSENVSDDQQESEDETEQPEIKHDWGWRNPEQYRGWVVPESDADEIFARLAAKDPDLAIAFEGIADGFALSRAGLSAEQATVFDQLVELGWAEIEGDCYVSRDPSAEAQSVSRAREDEEDLLPSGARLVGF